MLPLIALAVLQAPYKELVTLDKATIRWRKGGGEVALFGANYCLPSALDFRADMAHFARMCWDGLRFSFWGDWENTDRDGNLKANEHLDLMDYTLAEGARRGIRFLLSPIVTYDARWPEMREYPAVADGLSRFHQKGKLGTDPAAIKAQQNYLRQLLNHVNPYTHRAVKDEPSVVFVEMINEPWHHSEDPAGSVRYIDALVQAVRETGCRKLTFHNLSQDFRMLGPINESKVDGSTYGWYPTGLNANHQLSGNFLRFMDDYAPMRRPEIRRKPVIVYEFDLSDTDTAYGYPAMVREFRRTGAQFAAMFSYGMLATAPTNLGWTTHLLNLVYAPKKAAGAILAGEAMRRLPRFESYGSYPTNKRFGDFRVDDDLAELNATDAFVHAGDTKSAPVAPRSLRKVVGLGSSPIIAYRGRGLYFLDRIDVGRWRLEVYPDALQVDDPFRDPKKGDLKFRLVSRTWPITVRLPDLGSAFGVQGLDHALSASAKGGAFSVRPGVYLLTAKGAKGALPTTVAGMGLREFVCSSPTGGAPNVSLAVPRAVRAGAPFVVRAQVAADADPKSVVLQANGKTMPMRPAGPYAYEAILHTEVGALRLRVVADGTAAEAVTTVLGSDAPVVLFDPVRDARTLAVSRSGEGRNAVEALLPGSSEGRKALNLRIPTWLRTRQEDFTVSTCLGGLPLGTGGTLAVRLRGNADSIHLTLVDRDGNVRGVLIPAKATWETVEVPLAGLKPVRWAMLPQAFPGTWSCWADSLPGARFDPRRLERLQLSIRGFAPGFGVEIESVELRGRA